MSERPAYAPRPGVVQEQAWPAMREGPWPVALLPFGATEPHNTHLPYGTDTILGSHVAAQVSAACLSRGVNVATLPALPFGVNTTQLDLPFTINCMPSTQLALLRDVVQSLAPHGVRALVLLNAHGGNELRALVRELQPSTPVVLSIVNWWQAGDHAHFAEAGDHAGELETAAMLHVAPQLVQPDRASWGDGHARPSVFDGVRAGWAWMPRRWTQVTDDTGVGNPAQATAERGAAFVAQAVERIAAYCVQLASVDPAAMWRDRPHDDQ
ncbi:creatininase family protein [Gemmatimonas sp. UBA7669]|uniref:creatininase family protein n=1 Tax=Gemmatimonas sp. UBA7669 TaxID=1946568 RepID=UPI0025BADD41|nr:creatininase family protein [Gemmatimonas sp. UBA7669]